MAARWLEPKAVYGYFPAQSEGNDVIVYEPGEGSQVRELLRFTFPRQKEGRKRASPIFSPPRTPARGMCSDCLWLPSGVRRRRKPNACLRAANIPNISTCMDSAWRPPRRWPSTCTRKCVRNWESFGYPACPNLEDQTKLFALLHPEETVGVRLTSGFLLDPEQSTSAIVVHHPSAKYFVV